MELTDIKIEEFEIESPSIDEDFARNLEAVLAMEDGPEDIRILVAISGGYESRMTKTNKEYLDVPIADASSSAMMRVWDAVGRAKENFTPGSVWSLLVKKGSWADKPQITFSVGDSRKIAKDIEALYNHPLSEKFIRHLSRRYPKESLDVKGLLSPLYDATVLRSRDDLKAIFDEVFGCDLHALCDLVASGPFEEQFESIRTFGGTVFGDAESLSKFIDFLHAPSAKGHHGACVHGLFGHVQSMMKMADSISTIYRTCPSFHANGIYNHLLDLSDEETEKDFIDFDVIKLACIIHDYYKLDEYTWDDIGNVDYKERESLFHHDQKMAFRLQSIKQKYPAHEDTIDKLTHMVLRHHGQWSEYQPNPRRKTFPESDVFHAIDLIDARIVGAIEG